MTKKSSLFFLFLFGLPTSVQAVSSFLAELGQGNFLRVLEELFSSNGNILFFAFFVVMTFGCLFPPKGPKEDV